LYREFTRRDGGKSDKFALKILESVDAVPETVDESVKTVRKNVQITGFLVNLVQKLPPMRVQYRK
jgi:hypothetical protein